MKWADFLRRRVRTLEPRPAYALWAATYAPYAHNPLMAAEQAAMEALLAPLTASCALDVGTGSGRYLPLLARTGATTVVGLDLSLPMLKHNELGSRLVCAQAGRLPFPERAFDLVLASLVAGHLRDLAGWAREVRRVLRPGGHLLYSDFHPFGEAAGWQRTFKTAGGRWFAVQYFAHSMAEHQAALAAAGLEVRAVHEPRLGGQAGPEVEAFRRRWGDPPVAVAFHAVRGAS